MRHQLIEIADWLDAVYEALSVNDLDLFLSAFDPDARWCLLGHSAHLPFAGLRVGHAAIREMIGLIYRDFRMRDFFIEDIIANEGSAAVRWSALATSRATGRETHVEVFDHILFEGRSIRSLTQFFDTAAVGTSAGRIELVKGQSAG